MNTTDTITTALRSALDAIKATKASINRHRRNDRLPDGFDGVTFAEEMTAHASKIIDAERAYFRSTTHISAEAGFLAGYWLTIPLLQQGGMDEVRAHIAWLTHAEAWLTDEIKSNTTR
jgi:hypothetical protein